MESLNVFRMRGREIRLGVLRFFKINFMFFAKHNIFKKSFFSVFSKVFFFAKYFRQKSF